MPVMRFLGRVYPPGVNMNLANTHFGAAFSNVEGREAKWQLSIRDSNITVVVDMDKFDLKTDVRIAADLADSMIEIAVNLMALRTGMSLTPVLERLLTPDGTMIWLHKHEPNFARHITVGRTDETFDQMMMLIMTDLSLRMAVKDIADGLRHGKISPINSARAMDGICNYFIPEGGDRKAGWPLLHAALNVSRPYVESITELSKGPRHANWQTGNEPQSREIIERSWILMNRFLEYRQRGDQPLSGPEFPLLEVPQA